MTRTLVGGIAASAIVISLIIAPSAQRQTTFKLGTVERGGRTFVGVVLRDAVVIDLAAADKGVPGASAKVHPPTDMKDLIARYDAGLRERIHAIAAHVEQAGTGTDRRPPYVLDLKDVTTRP